MAIEQFHDKQLSPSRVDENTKKQFQRNLKFNQEMLDECCKRHSLKKLSLFGSVLTDNYRDDSDIDLIAEYANGKTPKELSPYFRNIVLEEAEPIYG